MPCEDSPETSVRGAAEVPGGGRLAQAPPENLEPGKMEQDRFEAPPYGMGWSAAHPVQRRSLSDGSAEIHLWRRRARGPAGPRKRRVYLMR